MRMKIKMNLSYALLLLAASLVDACSNEDNDAINETGMPAFMAATDSVRIAENDGVIMTYSLLNATGDTTSVFSEGEEIIFDLKIENSTDKHISIPNGPEWLGYNTFRVYTSDGKDCGTSWTYVQDWTAEMRYLWPHTAYSYQCPRYSESIVKASAPFIFSPSPKKLSKGAYYTEAHCKINDSTSLYCKLRFNIR